jgi:hypothetical protein
MEAYSVWASLNLKGNAIEQMGKFLAITKEVNESLSFLYKNISLLDDQLMASSASLKGLSSGFALLKTESAESLTAFDVSLSSSLKQVSALTTKTASLAAAMGTLKESSAGAALMGAGAVSGGYRGGRHYGMHGLNEMGMGAVAKPASALMGASVFGGPVAMGSAGVGILAYKGFEANKNYEMSIAQMRSLGLGENYVKMADSLAKNTHIDGVSQQDMIKAVVDAQMATRAGPEQFAEIKALAPILASAQFQSKLIFGHDMSDRQLQDMTRVSEIQGRSDTKKMQQWARASLNMMITSGGTIDPAKQLQFLRSTAGALNIDPSEFLSIEPILQELGTRTGTGYSTGGRALVQNIGMAGFSKKTVDYWEKIGLLHNGQMSKSSKDMYRQHPTGFVLDLLVPLLKKAGYKTEEDIMTALGYFPSSYGKDTVLTYKNATKIERARAMSNRILNTDQIDDSIKGNQKSAFAVAHLSTAWENFSLTFGKFSSPASVLAINLVSRALESLTVVMQALSHPIVYTKQAVNAISQVVSQDLSAHHTFSWQNVKDNMGAPYKKAAGEQQSGSIHLDGKKVGKVIFPHLANSINSSGTTASTGAFNSSLSMAPVGLSNYGNQQ